MAKARHRRPPVRSAGTGAQLGSDPGTVRNPHARPRAGSRRPVRAALPPVEDRPDEDVRFSLQRGDDPPGLAAIRSSVWELVYRAVFGDGYFDRIARFRRVIARDRAEAVAILQRLEYGFAERIILYEAVCLGDDQRVTSDEQRATNNERRAQGMIQKRKK